MIDDLASIFLWLFLAGFWLLSLGALFVGLVVLALDGRR